MIRYAIFGIGDGQIQGSSWRVKSLRKGGKVWKLLKSFVCEPINGRLKIA